MKRILLLLVTIATLSLSSFAQAPEGFSYQAVIRNSANLTLDNQPVGMQLKIREGSITGTVVYTETFATSTNSYGLVNLEIGSGTSADDFSAIAWATNGPFFIETAVDETGGTTYVVMGASKLMSVAYALHAKTAGNTSTNALDIATNTTAIADETARATAAEDGILVDISTALLLKFNISDFVLDFNSQATLSIQPAIDANTSGIATNTTDIATNTNNIATNTTDIATNTNNIATNTTDIATNTTNFSNIDYGQIFATQLTAQGLPVNTVMTGPLLASGNDITDPNLVNATFTGNVGIGTSTPIRGKLEIMGNQQCCGTTNGSFNYFLPGSGNTSWNWYSGPDNFDISVYADGRFMGSGIHIFSDERIKNVIGLSNNKKDLSTLLSLEITDYKMKDEAKGDRPYKKVIAQQVKEVYPQAISLTTEVVPDIYAVATIKNGYVSLETDLKAGEKVRLILEDETSLFDVISADKNGFKVSTNKSGKVFVYGREVDDFHAVDYESLSMLNVSATQELYKLILKQQKTIENQKTEISAHAAQLKAEISVQKEISEGMQSEFDARIKALEEMFNMSTLNK